MRLGRVVEDRHARRVADRRDLGDRRGAAEEVNGDHRPRGRRDRVVQPRRIQAARALVDVDEDRPRPREHDRLERREERERHGDHLVARADAERAQGEQQRVGAARDAHAVLRAAVGGELLLEGGQLGAQDEAAGGRDAAEELLRLRLDGFELNREVDLGHG